MTLNPRGKVLFAASIYRHLAAFHLPFMRMIQSWGYEVHALASSDGNQGDTVLLKANGVRCWEAPFSRSPYDINNALALSVSKALLSTECYDLVHVHTPVAAFIMRLAAKLVQRRPILYTAHGFHFYRGAPLTNWSLYYAAERMASRWTDGLIVMNQEDFDNGIRLGLNPGQSLFLVPGVGVDLDQFTATSSSPRIRKELGISCEDIALTCVGEMNPNKNQQLLLEAWAVLAEEFQNAHLLLVGEGPNLEILRQKVHHRAMPRVHFLGYRMDVPQIVRDSDIFTLVSKREGLPRCVLEAMAAGKPIVATDIRGNRDLVRHLKNGLLVQPGDVRGLVSALAGLIADRNTRTAMGRASVLLSQEYSLSRVLCEMELIYRRYLRN